MNCVLLTVDINRVRDPGQNIPRIIRKRLVSLKLC